MYDDFVDLISSMKCDVHHNVTRHMESIAEKYGVSQKTAYTRFTTYFGMSPKKYVRNQLTPTKEQLSSMIMNSETVHELWGKLPRDKTFWGGLFDQFYGVSTFKKAKEKILSEQSVVDYRVTREDNRSLLYSQLLGDGSYSEERHAIRVSHGIKQTEYLKWKVSLITKGYPGLSSEVKLHTHTQGHEYAHWYSGKLGNVDIPEKGHYHTLVDKLTPLGWLLWYLDDGSCTQNYSISVCNEAVEERAIEVLATYGITARRDNRGNVIMCGMVNDRLFSRCFLEPFMYMVPNSMHYKVKI
jgi:hypothetical protein